MLPLLAFAASALVIDADSIRNAKAELATVRALDRDGAVEILFSPGETAGKVRFEVAPGARDFTKAAALVFEFESEATFKWTLALFNRQGHRFAYSLQPWEKVAVRAAVPARFLRDEYMNNRSEFGYMISNWGNHIDLSGVAAIEISMRTPRPVKLKLGPVTLSAEEIDPQPLEIKPLVDEFGQWIPTHWPGKVRSLAELKSRWVAEDKALASRKPQPAMSKYGGWKPGSQPAKGFFYARKIDKRWWLVDPDGALFFSMGMDCVRINGMTPVAGREALYAWKPPVVQEERGRAGFDFYRENVKRRFGDSNYEPAWKKHQETRLKAWGFNTIGNWSADSMLDNPAVPYVNSIQARWTGKNWAGYPDTFSEDYEKALFEQVARQVKPRASDPYLIGWFVGNEPRWHERRLVERILEDPASSATQLFCRQFLEGSGDTPETREKLLEELARRYNNLSKEAIKAADPNHMVLGFRYAGAPADLILRANNVFDAFSINIYQFEPNPRYLERVTRILDKPIIIGEFHFGVAGRGMGPSLVPVKNYEERGVAFQYYMERAAAHWAVVGAHWFQMADQSVTGRYDGENYNLGFVTQTDLPYAEMVSHAQAAANRMYQIHAGEIMPSDRKPLVLDTAEAQTNLPPKPAPKPPPSKRTPSKTR
jgi:hypothetical protein